MVKKVLKFGGTSVGSIERIQHVADIIKKEHESGNQIIAVVSAMAGSTNELINFSKKISKDFNKRELDVLLSSGEQVSSALLAGALIDLKINAKSWVNWQIPILTEGEHSNARIINMHTDQINHDPAHTVMNTGTSISGRPSMGSWVTYGLGSMNDDLPGFVVLTSQGGRNPQPISSRQWGSGFLPSKFQGVQFYSQGDPVHYVRSSPGINRQQQSRFVDTVGKLNRIRNNQVNNPEIESRIAQYELAFRMQASVPELMDFAGEPQHVLDRYGVKNMDGSFASNCLLARRLAERGTRFIHLYHRGPPIIFNVLF